jgi:ATP synthase F1 gamma subunit
VLEEERKPKHLIVAISSDRGLCGSVHSNVARYIRSLMSERGQDASTTMFVCVGDKVRTILQRQFKSNILMHFTEIGRKPPLFMEANFVAEQILNSGLEYDSAEIVFNRFRYVCMHSPVCSVHTPVLYCVPIGMWCPTERHHSISYHLILSHSLVRIYYMDKHPILPLICLIFHFREDAVV